MVKVNVGNNLKRSVDIVPPETTLREVLERAGVDYHSSTVNLDGSTVNDCDLDMTFAYFDITDVCFLLSVTKVDNAA